MSAWAKPGVKCVCVGRPKSTDFRGIIRVPDVYETLTIRDVFIGVLSDGTEAVTLRFSEIQNPVVDTTHGMVERGYWAAHFRPLVTRTQEQDLALFTPILDSLPIREDA